MPCYHPLSGYRSRVAGASGKFPIVFNLADGYKDLPVTVPCGQCIGCRLLRSRQWAMRCVHEASLHDANCFLTLTLDDAHLPPGGSLDKTVFQKFMKRLRKRFSDEKIRFFHCGEYGTKYGRPHYHVLLFGFDFPDKQVAAVRRGYKVWRSAILENLWPLGMSEIGSVTFESAAYVARYILKKVTGEDADDYYLWLDQESGELGPLVPEYVTMSRRPGVGAEWFRKFGSEVYPDDTVVIEGREMKPPRFYDDMYELVDRAGALEVARERRRCRRLEDETPERLIVREKVTRARVALSERGFE